MNEEAKCPYCNNTFKNIVAVRAHKGYCYLNPNRTIHRSHLSDEHKQKISIARKKYISEHDGATTFKSHHSSKESYPEKYIREWLQKTNLFCEQEFHVGPYSLDFAWPDKMIYLEVDGNQHHLDWMIEHDKVRTDYLNNLSWKCIARIDWQIFSNYTIDEKILYLFNLEQSINSSSVIRKFKSEHEKKLEKIQQELDDGIRRIDSIGRAVLVLDWEARAKLILSCDVDFSKFGWQKEVEQLTGLTRRQIYITMQKCKNLFAGVVFERKHPTQLTS